MNIRQLHYMITLEEEGNTIQAAEKLGISQSTLSKYLAGLETSLGVSLFARSKKQLIPTVYGKVYLDAARKILQIYELSARTIAGMHDSEKIELSIGIPRYTDIHFQSFLLSSFQKKYPHILLHIQEMESWEALEQIQNETLSFALIRLCGEYQEPFSYLPASEEILVFATPDFSQEYTSNQEIVPEELIRIVRTSPLILPPSGTDLRIILDSLFSAWRLEPLIICESNTPEVRLDLTRKNIGSTFLPDAFAKHDNTVFYLCSSDVFTIKRSIIYLKKHLLTAPEQYCLDLIRQYENS